MWFVFYDQHWNVSRLQKASKAMDCKRRQDWEGEDDCKNCATVPVEKKSRLEWETEVESGLEHTREGSSGQNIVDQLIREEQEITGHLLKRGEVENGVDSTAQNQEGGCLKEELKMTKEKVADPFQLGPVESKTAGERNFREDADPLDAKENLDISSTDGESKVIVIEGNVKEEIVIEDDVEENPGDKDEILQPVVILDGQSVARMTKYLYLTPEEKLSKAYGYFAKKGFKIVTFFPGSMVKKVKNASNEVKASLKLTTKKLPRTYENPWGMDRWEVVYVTLFWIMSHVDVSHDSCDTSTSSYIMLPSAIPFSFRWCSLLLITTPSL